MDIDFKIHNREVRAVWEAYHAGKPFRVPMILGLSERSFLSDPALNTRRITYFDYHNNPETMLQVQLEFQDFVRHHILADHEMGLPDAWPVKIDGGNFHHSAWYGSEIHYLEFDSPDTTPMLNDDNKYLLFDRGIPDPFGGIYARYQEMYEYLRKKSKHLHYRGIPISPEITVPAAQLAGNGIPFTTACKLRGAAEMCLEMALDTDYAKKLLEYVTEAVIVRTKAWREYLGLPIKTETVFLGDDSVILLSPQMYREFVLPCHRRIYEEFGTPGAVRGIHLCGGAAKHFQIMRRELNVTLFDTGFPIDLQELYQDLGDEVTIQGGIHIELLRSGLPEEIAAEIRGILEEVKPYRKFILRDANHLAPGTAVANLNAMYQSCREYGNY